MDTEHKRRMREVEEKARAEYGAGTDTPEPATEQNASIYAGATAQVQPGGLYGNDCAKVAYSRAEVHERAANHHRGQMQKNIEASMFLRQHPEFATFLDLLKSGAIAVHSDF